MIRRLLGIDWLCQGCSRQGSYRWLTRHDCPKRDELQIKVRAWFKEHPGTHFYCGSIPELDTEGEQHG